MSQSSRTEPATPRRKEKARRQGQLPRSRELTSALAFGVAALLLATLAGSFGTQWRRLFRHLLELAVSGQFGNGIEALTVSGAAVLQSTLPLLLLSWCVAVVASLAQGGLVFSLSSLAPHASRIHPAENIKKVFSLGALSGALKSLIPLSVLLYLFTAMLARDWSELARAVRFSPALSASWLMDHAWEILWKAAFVFSGWALVDYFMQRASFNRQLRMTPLEVRDEHRETEGSPLVKGRIRRLQQTMRRSRMLHNVAQATVVVTNPDHYAVALKYDPETTPAPVVVAKGRNRIARQIKQLAHWKEIPMVENPPLAQALYRTVEVGQAIPAKLYRAVAEILAFIYRAQARAQARSLPAVSRIQSV